MNSGGRSASTVWAKEKRKAMKQTQEQKKRIFSMICFLLHRFLSCSSSSDIHWSESVLEQHFSRNTLTFVIASSHAHILLCAAGSSRRTLTPCCSRSSLSSSRRGLSSRSSRPDGKFHQQPVAAEPQLNSKDVVHFHNSSLSHCVMCFCLPAGNLWTGYQSKKCCCCCCCFFKEHFNCEGKAILNTMRVEFDV